jgi:hypothetical protein
MSALTSQATSAPCRPFDLPPAIYGAGFIGMSRERLEKILDLLAEANCHVEHMRVLTGNIERSHEIAALRDSIREVLAESRP